MASVGRTAVLDSQLIPKSGYKETVTQQKGATIEDIIKGIIKGDRLYHTDTADFSKTFDFSKHSNYKKFWSIIRLKTPQKKPDYRGNLA